MAKTGKGLKIGVARRDISPDRSTLLKPTGMDRLERTRGVLDPLYVEALAVESDGDALVITTSDLRRVWYAWSREIQERVAERIGCDRHRVWLGAVHCHSSSPMAADDSPESRRVLDEAERKIVDAFVDASVEAWDGRRRAELGFARAEVSLPIGQCRRMRLSNGTVVSQWGSGPVAPPGTRFAGTAATDAHVVSILAAREPGARWPFAVLSSYATHPHLGAVPYFSGEFSGAAKRAIEARLPGTTALHASSTAGDQDLHVVHPIPTEGMDAEVEWFRRSSTALGERFADVVVPAVRGIDEWSDCGAMRFAWWSEGEEGAGDRVITVVSAAAVGDVVLVSIPGEMFIELGEQLLAKSPFAKLVMVGYNGSNNAYLVPPKAFEDGGYEVMRGAVAEGVVALMPCKRRVQPTATKGLEVLTKALELLSAVK